MDESVGRKGKVGIGCAYMPTDSMSVAVLDTCYERLKEDILSFREVGDLNARVVKAAADDDVFGKFGEDTCNLPFA